MAIEIERKYLIKNDTWRQKVQKSTIIRQGFLNTEPERTVRVRQKGNKGFLTIKVKTEGIARLEFEYEIPLVEAQELLHLCLPHLIEKERFIVLEKGLTWEIDVFSGNNKGLIIAEVELDSSEQDILLPDWIAEEVSTDARYYNSNLSQSPFCDWE